MSLTKFFQSQSVTSCFLRPAPVICTHLCPDFQSVLFLCSRTNLCAQFNICSMCALHHIRIMCDFVIVMVYDTSLHSFVLCIATKQRTGRFGVRILLATRDFSLFQNAQTFSGAHPDSYWVVTEFMSQGKSGRGVKLTSDLHLLPRLRLSGAIPLLPIHSFMACTGNPFTYV